MPTAHTCFCPRSRDHPARRAASSATESVAAKTGDTVGGLLNASLGNLTELVIALTALRAGMFDLVKSSIAGAIVANLLFMLGISFLVGGWHHVQEYNAATARLQIAMVLLATVTLLVPPRSPAGSSSRVLRTWDLSVGLSILLVAIYALGLLFSLGTHREVFGSKAHAPGDETPWPLPVAMIILAVATIFIALVSEVFVGSVEHAALQFGMSAAFVGFIVVAIVGERRRRSRRSPPPERTGSISALASRSAARRRSLSSSRRC